MPAASMRLKDCRNLPHESRGSAEAGELANMERDVFFFGSSGTKRKKIEVRRRSELFRMPFKYLR